MDQFITEETVTLVGAIFGLVWAFFRSQDWYKGLQEQRFGRALTALEAGVQYTYDTYVRAIKEASEDGKLTNTERRRARELARNTAINIGRTDGIDVIKEIGVDYINLWIERSVKEAKAPCE